MASSEFINFAKGGAAPAAAPAAPEPAPHAGRKFVEWGGPKRLFKEDIDKDIDIDIGIDTDIDMKVDAVII